MDFTDFASLGLIVLFAWFRSRIDIRKLENLANSKTADRLDAYLLEQGKREKKAFTVALIASGVLFSICLFL